MGSVLRSFGAFQGNIWYVAPFIPVGPGENQCCPHKTRIFSKNPNGPIFNFFLVVQNIVFDIIHSKIRPNNIFPYIRILTSCGSQAGRNSEKLPGPRLVYWYFIFILSLKNIEEE